MNYANTGAMKVMQQTMKRHFRCKFNDSNDILHKVSGSTYLDYKNDDYYNHNISSCYDLKNNNFLI